MSTTKVVLVGGSPSSIATLKAALTTHNEDVVITTTGEGVVGVAPDTSLHSIDICSVIKECQDCGEWGWGEKESQLPHCKPYLANNKRDIYRSRGKVGKRR